MYLKTHSLQHAPLTDQGGRINSHVKGSVFGQRPSIQQNMSAAFSPLLIILFPSISVGTEK